VSIADLFLKLLGKQIQAETGKSISVYQAKTEEDYAMEQVMRRLRKSPFEEANDFYHNMHPNQCVSSLEKATGWWPVELFAEQTKRGMR
jgi:cytochrome c553